MAEDYETIRIKDIDHLYKGKSSIHIEENGPINKLYKDGKVSYSEVEKSRPVSNHYYILKNHSSSALGYYNPKSDNIELVQPINAYGITPRNAEQTFAMHAMMNPDVLLASITGAAGTGKTLLALACALEQRRQYRQIYLARPIVPLSNRDLGYLPGDVKSKIDPYMQPLWDNLSIIKNQYKRIEQAVQKSR
jgi:PhoH-like ATPase